MKKNDAFKTALSSRIYDGWSVEKRGNDIRGPLMRLTEAPMWFLPREVRKNNAYLTNETWSLK